MNSINTTSISSSVSSGLSTISAGNQRLSQDAQQIANPDRSAAATSSIADLGQASLQAQAGAAVIRISDQMLGSLLDAFA